MGQLHGGVAADGGAGGDALGHGGLGGADEGVGTLAVVVGHEIHHAYKTPTGVPVPQGTFHQDHGIGMRHQHAAEVVLHGGQHSGFTSLGLGQVDLGDNETEGGGSFGGRGIGTLPVFGLGGVLVAGHAGPGGAGICRKIGQKNLCGLEGDGHGKLLSENKKCENDSSDQALLYRINGKIARAWRKFLSHPTKKRKIFHNKTFCSQNIV